MSFNEILKCRKLCVVAQIMNMMHITNKIPYRSPDLYKYVTDIVLDIIPRDSDLELKTGDSKPLGSGLESPKVKPRLNSTLQLFLCAVSV